MKSIILKLNRTGFKLLFFLLITFLLFFGTVVSPANAKVTGWELSPENPKDGETLIISGFASPGEEVEISVSFEKTVPVYLREYTYEFENIEVLNFNNILTVRAEGVENLKVKMKMVLSKTESAWADDGIATVSHSGVPPGEYRVRVDGIAEDGASGVNLKVTTVQKLKAGEDGKFSYRYRTGSVPSGKLEVKLGNSEKEIILDAKGSSPLVQAPSTSSHAQQLEESEEIKASGPVLPANTEFTDTELTDRGNEEKRSICLTESSWDEDISTAATAGEVSSKKSVEKKEIQEQGNQFVNFFYLLAGVLAGIGVLLAARRKK